MVALSNKYQSQDNYQTGIRVEHALIRSYPGRFLHVIASAFYGIVELSGTVMSHQDKSLAIEIAGRVPGVTTVVESLQVGKPFVARRAAACIPSEFRSRDNNHRGRKSDSFRWDND